jgi:Xaa-Pro aminopeptidase
LFGAASNAPRPETGLRWLDSGANYRGYTSDYDRMVAWGEPSAEALAVHAALRDTYVEAMEAWRPGRAFPDIARDTAAAIARSGFADPLGGAFMGHNLGSEVVERPWFGLRAPRDLVLAPGMVIAPEWLTATPLGEFLWEDNFLVTETGLERLSDYGPDLAVVAD